MTQMTLSRFTESVTIQTLLRLMMRQFRGTYNEMQYNAIQNSYENRFIREIDESFCVNCQFILLCMTQLGGCVEGLE